MFRGFSFVMLFFGDDGDGDVYDWSVLLRPVEYRIRSGDMWLLWTSNAYIVLKAAAACIDDDGVRQILLFLGWHILFWLVVSFPDIVSPYPIQTQFTMPSMMMFPFVCVVSCPVLYHCSLCRAQNWYDYSDQFDCSCSLSFHYSGNFCRKALSKDKEMDLTSYSRGQSHELDNT